MLSRQKRHRPPTTDRVDAALAAPSAAVDSA
jgi:hypothetical protein